MDHSLSRQSIKPQRLGIFQALMVSVHARIDGPKHKRGSLPLGTLEPQIAQIEQSVKKRNQRLAAICSNYRYRIPAAIKQAAIQIKHPESELSIRQRDFEAAVEQYKIDHDGKEPPQSSVAFTKLAGFWFLGGLFTAGEWPLMSAAFERLPLSDWQRSVAVAAASAVIIYMAHQIGIWFAKPGKTFAQAVFGWVLVLVLSMILMFAALMRRDAIHSKSPGNSVPEVYIRHEGGHTFHV
jgi:hypothetical protein